MTIQEAYKILGVTKEDDEKAIKLQFRKLIAKYHPDTVGTDAPTHLQRAQQINEAYALLRKRAHEKQAKPIKRPVWKGKLKESAFTERTIYMEGVSWEGEKAEFYMVARGQYEWDPELEEFQCFLKSVSEAVMELLEKAEEQNGIFNDYDYDIKALRFDYQIQLFHLLAGQFISPISCLKKLASPIEIDAKARRIYKFQAFLGAKGIGGPFTALSKLQQGDAIYATSLKNNRIMVANAKGEVLGHLSLADDALYYVIIPILQNHLAQVKFMVRERDLHKNIRPYRIKVIVDLYLRMEDTAKEITLADQNIRIGEVLNQYDSVLREITK